MLDILDPVVNFGKVTVSTTYDDSATEIVLETGHGAKLPCPLTYGEYNLVWWDSKNYPDPADDPNKEIVRVIECNTDTLTIQRNQESSGASTKSTADGVYKMILSATKKTIDDIQSNFDVVEGAINTIGARYYMLDAADGDIASYKQISMTASDLSTASVSASVNAATDTLIEEWVNPSGQTFSGLSSGTYDLNIFAERTAGNRAVRIFWRFYERKADTSEVLIVESNLSDLVTSKARLRIYATLSEDYTPEVGSRLVGKVYFNTAGGSQNTTCVLYYQGTEDSHWDIPVGNEYLDATYGRQNVPFTDETTVTVTHNLGVYPMVQVMDSSGNVFLPDVKHSSINAFTVTFAEQTTGTIIY